MPCLNFSNFTCEIILNPLHYTSKIFHKFPHRYEEEVNRF